MTTISALYTLHAASDIIHVLHFCVLTLTLCSINVIIFFHWISQYAEVNKNLNSSWKFPVIVHANYCNGKSHELAVRGLWLLGDNYTDTDSSQCQSFRLDHTHYNIFNWPLEVQQINHKRAYMYDTFINNGSLVQGSNSLAVYAIDSNRRWTMPYYFTIQW